MGRAKRFAERLGGGGRGRRGVVFGRAVAGIDDDTGLAPGGDEGEAGGGFVELDDEVIEVFELFHEIGDFGFEFFLERTAADDASTGRGIYAGKGGERGLELGDESGVTPRSAAPVSLAAAVPMVMRSEAAVMRC